MKRLGSLSFHIKKDLGIPVTLGPNDKTLREISDVSGVTRSVTATATLEVRHFTLGTRLKQDIDQ